MNQDERKPIVTALNGLMRALGLKPNDCNCQEPPMSKLKDLAAAILADVKTLPAALQVNLDTAELEKMSETSLTGLSAWIKAIQKAAMPPDKDKEAEMMKANQATAAAAAASAAQPLTIGQLKELVTNTVKEAVGAALSGDAIGATIKRGEIKARLLANSACAFTAPELETMSFEALEKYEKSIRPADYSGQGGFHAQTGADVVENPFNGGVLATMRADAAAAKKQ